MQTKLTGSATGAIAGYFSAVPPLIPVGAFVGWQLASFFSEKEIDGEKIVYGTPGDNGSYPNYKRILPNSIRWTKASIVSQRLKGKKKQKAFMSITSNSPINVSKATSPCSPHT